MFADYISLTDDHHHYDGPFMDDEPEDAVCICSDNWDECVYCAACGDYTDNIRIAMEDARDDARGYCDFEAVLEVA